MDGARLNGCRCRCWALRNSFKQVSSIESASINAGQEGLTLARSAMAGTYLAVLLGQSGSRQQREAVAAGRPDSRLRFIRPSQKSLRTIGSCPGPPLLQSREKNPGMAYENGSITIWSSFDFNGDLQAGSVLDQFWRRFSAVRLGPARIPDNGSKRPHCSAVSHTGTPDLARLARL